MISILVAKFAQPIVANIALSVVQKKPSISDIPRHSKVTKIRENAIRPVTEIDWNPLPIANNFLEYSLADLCEPVHSASVYEIG